MSFVEAFWNLSTCRVIGPTGVPGPIAWTAVDAYAERYHITRFDDLYQEFQTVIGSMDKAFLDHSHKKAEANQQAASAKS